MVSCDMLENAGESQSPGPAPDSEEKTQPHVKPGQAEHAYILFPSNEELSISKLIPLTSGPARPQPPLSAPLGCC